MKLSEEEQLVGSLLLSMISHNRHRTLLTLNEILEYYGVDAEAHIIKDSEVEAIQIVGVEWEKGSQIYDILSNINSDRGFYFDINYKVQLLEDMTE